MRRFRILLELPFLCGLLTGAFTIGSHAIPLTQVATPRAAATSSMPQSQPLEEAARVSFTIYCSGCHQSGRSGMDFTDETLNLEEMRRNRSDWEEVVRRVRTHEMPPQRFPQPRAWERETIIAWIEQEVLHKPGSSATGKLMARRLQRVEYINTVCDLLGVQFQPSGDFPKDDAGWSRCSAVPELVTTLKTSYRSAADKLLDQAMAAELDSRPFASGEDYDGADAPHHSHNPEHVPLFSCDPSERAPEDVARDLLADFARRAYRGPVDASEIDRLVAVFEQAEQDDMNFAECMKVALAEVLTSPRFLCRVEPRDSSDAAAGDQFALAARLSYFLWRTTPDDELLMLAGQGTLTRNLELQVKRMLREPQARALVLSFGTSWLSLEKLDYDQGVDKSLRRAMRQETELFLETIWREDRSVLEVIDADFTFVNERLANHYGLSGVRGEQMRRIDVRGTMRGGLLGQASVLRITSGIQQTSPVNRGKWVLEKLLGAAPIRPPAGLLQALQNSSVDGAPGTLRQQLARHRSEPSCAQCHAKLDAIGITLENFDARGAWRTQDGPRSVEAIGEFPDGSTLDGPGALKAYLLKQREAVVRNLAERMLSLALGRKLDAADRAALAKVPENVAGDQHRFSRLVVEVVTSEPFRQGFAGVTR